MSLEIARGFGPSVLIAVPALVSACAISACAGDPDAPQIRKAPAPSYLGSADATGDSSDHSCAVVLRTISRVKNGPGYLTTCDTGAATSGSCLYIWRGTIDVAADEVEDYAAVQLLFSTNQTGGQWYALEATRAGAANDGYVPFSFEIAEHTPAAGMSMTSLMRTRLNVIPYLETTAGGRVFDHNRVSDPFGNYTLTSENGWAIEDDPAVCAPVTPAPTPIYELSYPTFTEHLRNGLVRAGGELEVRYDSRRLRETQPCMGSQGPASATTIHMGWRVNGDASTTKTRELELYVESSVGCQAPPCVTVSPRDARIQLPKSATSLQMWFYCVPGFSQGAQANWKYDSNFGQNYELPVMGAPQQKAVDWAGDWRLHAARSGFTFAVPEPYTYKGYTHMGYSIQAEVYVKGLTDQAQPNSTMLEAYVESDLNDQCQPGGALTRVELPIAETQTGSYGNNVLYRWGVEGLLLRCPNGAYRYRFLFSADGGQTTTILGAADDINGADATKFRTIVNQK